MLQMHSWVVAFPSFGAHKWHNSVFLKSSGKEEQPYIQQFSFGVLPYTVHVSTLGIYHFYLRRC